MSVDFRQLVQFGKALESLEKIDINKMYMELSKEVAQIFLAKVIPRTPVDTGFLRNQWTSKNTRIVKKGNEYQIYITNTSEYADYMEYGHRTRGGKGWVNGYFFATITEKEIEGLLPKMLEKKISKIIKDRLK
jgi:hypothetical protein